MCLAMPSIFYLDRIRDLMDEYYDGLRLFTPGCTGLLAVLEQLRRARSVFVEWGSAVETMRLLPSCYFWS